MSSVHRVAPAGPTIYACAQAGCQACLERLLRQHVGLVHWVIRRDCRSELPYGELLHEGQIDGCRAKLPVQLGRRPLEPADGELRAFYLKLIETVNGNAFREGQWQLCDCSGWPDNQSCANLVSWCWRKEKACYLIVVNLSAGSAQGLIQIPWHDLAGRTWRLIDSFTGAVYERDGDELQSTGLFVDLPAWGFHLLKVQ